MEVYGKMQLCFSLKNKQRIKKVSDNDVTRLINEKRTVYFGTLTERLKAIK